VLGAAGDTWRSAGINKMDKQFERIKEHEKKKKQKCKGT
jgi:hypothetical protein